MARSDVSLTKSHTKTGFFSKKKKKKRAKDELTELRQGADRARYEVCYHGTDLITPVHIRVISRSLRGTPS